MSGHRECSRDETVIVYDSCALDSAGHRYSTQRRLLSLVYFRYYFQANLQRLPFEVRIHHHLLQWLREGKQRSAEVVRQ